MRKNLCLLSLAALAMSVTANNAFAGDDYELEGLDFFKSCATSVQKENAELALSFLKAFSWWNMKDQMAMIHPDYISWHSSIAGLLVAKPELAPYVPAKNGQWTKANYIEVMAFLAYANDTSKYKTKPVRVDCVGNDSVMLVTEFTGMQIRRDPATGCVTHGVKFGSPTKIMVDIRELDGQKMIYRSASNLIDEVSARVREELAEIVKGPPNMPEDPGNCKTRAQILKEFQDQLNH